MIVATGGLSVPTTGSDGLGLRVLARLGHAMHPTYAALTPITADCAAFAALSGVSLSVTLTARSAARSAWRGWISVHPSWLQRPAVLDVSHVAVRARE